MNITAFQQLAFQCRAVKLPEPIAEFRFHPTRKWRFDGAFPSILVAVAIEGVTFPTRGQGGYLTGRHVSVSGFLGDLDKYGEAFALGWTVLRILPRHVMSGQALNWLEPVLRRKAA